VYKGAVINHYQISNFTFAILLLLVGKVAVFMFYKTPDVAKMYVDASLIGYFVVFVLTLSRLADIPRKYHIWLQILMLPIVAPFAVQDEQVGLFIFFADMYLLFLLMISRFKHKKALGASFVILGGINLLSYLGLITYHVYAVMEPFGQILFVMGLKKLAEDYIEE